MRQILTGMRSVVRCFSSTSERTLSTILKENFPKAKSIVVKDISGGCGAMFQVLIETEEFRGLSILKQHRMALKSDVEDIHGLTVSTKAL